MTGIEVEVLGAERAAGLPEQSEIERLCAAAAAARGIHDGHLAIEIVEADRIAELNARHRGRSGPTDVLSFPIDGAEELGGMQRELGDVVICPQATADMREAIVHGVLHLLGMDHETDAGEMLCLQDRILSERAAAGRRRAALSAGGGR